MLGNVREWCADGRRKYTADPVEDPVGPMDVGSRCVRGGSWGYGARLVRCAYRIEYPPVYRDEGLGFRLVRVQDGS
jgi:formylglycine-generating enzyme required for sulfatase activity